MALKTDKSWRPMLVLIKYLNKSIFMSCMVCRPNQENRCHSLCLGWQLWLTTFVLGAFVCFYCLDVVIFRNSYIHFPDSVWRRVAQMVARTSCRQVSPVFIVHQIDTFSEPKVFPYIHQVFQSGQEFQLSTEIKTSQGTHFHQGRQSAAQWT